MPPALQMPVAEYPSWNEADLRLVATRFLLRLGEVPVARVPMTLRELLRSLGTRLGIDRATVFTLTPDRHGFRTICSWSDNGVPALGLAEYRAVSSRLVERTLEGKITRLDRVEDSIDHSSADREALARVQQRSLLIVPLRVGGGTVGAYTLGGVRRYISWPEALLGDLAPISSVLAGGLERVAMSRRLSKAQAEHDQTQRIAGIGHWRYDFASRATHASQELKRTLRLDPRAEFDMQKIASRVHPQERELFTRHVNALLFGSSLDPIECRVLGRRGRPRWFRCWGEVTTDVEGLPIVAHGVFHDITDRRNTQDELEQTTRRLVAAQEDERARLGRDLHDDLGQRITALSLQLDSLRQRAEQAAPELSASLAAAKAELSEVGLIVRDLSHSLHPADLRRLGLVASLESLCRRCSMIGDVDVVFDHDASSPLEALSPDAELALFRVVQESVSNALKHAEAGKIEVSAGCRVGWAWVAVLDDGKGFDADNHDADRGLGLVGMEERMRQVGGMLSVASQPGSGSEVIAEVRTLERD